MEPWLFSNFSSTTELEFDYEKVWERGGSGFRKEYTSIYFLLLSSVHQLLELDGVLALDLIGHPFRLLRNLGSDPQRPIPPLP